MQQNFSEKDLRRILGAELGTSEIMERRLDGAYERIRSAKTRPARYERYLHRSLIAAASVAAVFLLMITFCVMNPVLASEVPVLGGFFSKLSDIFSFGQIPQEETTILFAQDGTAVIGDGGDQAADAQYQKTSNGVTVTLTEQYATNQAIFIGICIETEQEVPPLAVFTDGSQILHLQTTETYSFRPDALVADRMVEGRWEDAHTFIGIMRIDYSQIDVDESKYAAALREAGEKGESLPLTDENMWQYLELYDVPESFTMGLEIVNIIGALEERTFPEGMKSSEELAAMTEEEWAAYMKTLPAEYSQFPNRYEEWWQEGSWGYELHIVQKDSASRVIEIDETNDDGIGIKSIELSAVEMTLNTIEPTDTIAVALDADGNRIENGGTYFYELSIEGHDISTIYIYICDETEYLDELKGYAYPENNDTGKTFQEILEEHALFRTTVRTDPY